MPRRLRALRLVHPYPSALNAALVVLIATAAGASTSVAAILGTAMLGMQFAIGTTNDVMDRALDAEFKPWKPIPAGDVSLQAARLVAGATAVGGFVLTLVVGPVPVSMLWLGMLACGLAYDFWLKPTPFAWACFSIAFALLPIYSWFGATQSFPPLWQFVVFLAFLAGLLLSLGNGLTDLEGDSAAGLRTPATLLDRRKSLLAMAFVFIVIQATAWLVLAPMATTAGLALLAIGSSVGAVSLFLSTGSQKARLSGSNGQFLAVFLLALAWLETVR